MRIDHYGEMLDYEEMMDDMEK
jgi:hypothetical protein